MLALLDNRLLDDCHVVLEDLGVGKSTRLVDNLHRHLLRKDVDQLDAVAVLAAHQLLLVLVVVSGCQQLPKDHLGNPDLVFGVLGDINGLSVVRDAESLRVALDGNGLDGVLRVLLTQADDLVVGVHQELVHQLVEARVDGNSGCLEVVSIAHKHLFGASHNATHVGVGKVEDVLAVRLALVVGRESHGEICGPSHRPFRFHSSIQTNTYASEKAAARSSSGVFVEAAG